MSGEEAESGIARDVYLELKKRYPDSFEVLPIALGSPESFLYSDEYLAIECEDAAPVVFLDGRKVVCGFEDAERIADSIGALLTC